MRRVHSIRETRTTLSRAMYPSLKECRYRQFLQIQLDNAVQPRGTHGAHVGRRCQSLEGEVEFGVSGGKGRLCGNKKCFCSPWGVKAYTQSVSWIYCYPVVFMGVICSHEDLWRLFLAGYGGSCTRPLRSPPPFSRIRRVAQEKTLHIFFWPLLFIVLSVECGLLSCGARV